MCGPWISQVTLTLTPRLSGFACDYVEIVVVASSPSHFSALLKLQILLFSYFTYSVRFSLSSLLEIKIGNNRETAAD